MVREDLRVKMEMASKPKIVSQTDRGGDVREMAWPEGTRRARIRRQEMASQEAASSLDH